MWEEFPHLARAPITEALLDVRVQPNPAATVDAISAAFRGRLGGAFPEEKPIQQMHAQLAFGGEGGGGVAAAAQQTIGHILWTADHKRAVQARADGFSVNHVGDYKDWDAIVGDARRYWTEYLAAAAPLRVIRCAARFINRMEVPAGDDLRRHLQTRPEIGDQLPPLMEEYFMRVVLPFSDRRRTVITQATIPEAVGGSGRRPLLLEWFHPDVRAGERQRVCSAECRRERSRAQGKRRRSKDWEGYRAAERLRQREHRAAVASSGERPRAGSVSRARMDG